MKATHLRFGIVVAGLLLTAHPMFAQGRPDSGGGAGSGGDRGGSTTSAGGGTSSNSGGGGGNIAGGGGGGGGSIAGGGSTSSGGFSSPSASAISSPSMRMGDSTFRSTAPEHRLNYSDGGQHVRTASSGSSGDSQKASPRSSGGGSSASGSNGSSGSRSGGSNAASGPRSNGSNGDHAVPRGAASSNGDNGGRRANEGAASNNTAGATEVPSWARSRPGGGQGSSTDTAVPRVGAPPDKDTRDHLRDGGGAYYYDPFYYGGFGYGFGYNTGFCSPAYYSCNQGFYGYPFYSPFGFGYGIPSGYFDPYYSDPYDYGGGYGSYSSSVYGGHDQGNLKLKVKPRNAKVYVDGFYVGLVDEFDGAFQKLTLNGGRHKVELRADGYETTEFDVLITPEQTVTFAGDMKKIQ